MSELAAQAQDFDPRKVLHQARKGRSREDKFDSFSDAYIWVLVAVFGLAYAFGLMRAGLGALLGEFSAPASLPTAVLPLSDVLSVGALLIPLLVLRLMLYLGPAAVSAAQGVWWLALPIDLGVLRRSGHLRAGWIGALTHGAGWVLWYALCASVQPSRGWLALVVGLAGALVAGVVLADTAVLAQVRGSGQKLHRISTMMLYVLLAVCIADWAVHASGVVPAGVPLASRLLWRPELFGAVALALLLVALPVRLAARRALPRIAPKVLRAAGRCQRTVHAALAVMDPGALGEAGSQVRAGRRRGARPPGIGWPVALTAVFKRGWRRRLHERLLAVLLVLSGMVLLVDGAANPMVLALGMLVLLIQLVLTGAAALEPLLAGGFLPRMLGIGVHQVARSAAYAVLPLALLLTVLACAAAVLLLGNHAGSALVPAILLATAGTLSGTLQRARRGRRDWSTELQGVGTPTGALPGILYSASGMLPLLAGALPLLALLLSAGTQVPWTLWAVAVFASWPGLRSLAMGR